MHRQLLVTAVTALSFPAIYLTTIQAQQETIKDCEVCPEMLIINADCMLDRHSCKASRIGHAISVKLPTTR